MTKLLANCYRPTKDQSYIAKILTKIRQSDLLIAINQQEEQMDLDHIYIAKCVDRQRTSNGLTKTKNLV